MSKTKKRDGHKTLKSTVFEYLQDSGIPDVDIVFVRKLEAFDKAHEGLRLNNKHFRELAVEMHLEIRAKNAAIALLEREKATLKQSLRQEIGNIKVARNELTSMKRGTEDATK